jgi:hypothetical protein
MPNWGHRMILASLLLVLALTPAATAFAPSGLHIPLPASFHGRGIHSSIFYRSGCGRNSDLPRPFFNGTSGIAGLNISSYASSCTKSGGNSSAEVHTMVTGRVNMPTRPGATLVYANFSYAAELRAFVQPGFCSSFSGASFEICATYSEFNISISAELVDKNTSYYWGATGGSPGAHWGLTNETYCFSGGCGGYGGGTGCNYASGGWVQASRIPTTCACPGMHLGCSP